MGVGIYGFKKYTKNANKKKIWDLKKFLN
jgi:hypothetical protein